MNIVANFVLFIPLATEAFFSLQHMSLQSDALYHLQLQNALSQAFRDLKYEVDTEVNRLRRSQSTEYEPVCLLK